jgi:GDP-D-mannose 3',5'-epimerase
LLTFVECTAGIALTRYYNLSAPQGVRGRNSDNTLILERLGWSPSISLEEGLRNIYKWIFDQL